MWQAVIQQVWVLLFNTGRGTGRAVKLLEPHSKALQHAETCWHPSDQRDDRFSFICRGFREDSTGTTFSESM